MLEKIKGKSKIITRKPSKIIPENTPKRVKSRNLHRVEIGPSTTGRSKKDKEMAEI